MQIGQRALHKCYLLSLTKGIWGVLWLAQWVDYTTLDLRVVSSSLTWGVEITYKREKTKRLWGEMGLPFSRANKHCEY